jgi:hypothetical protein
MSAPRGNRNAVGNKGGGRKSTYKPEHVELARKLCLLGATDKEMGDVFGVSEATVHLWRQTHLEFAEAIKEGKAAADANVANRLYRRAMGYSHEAVKIVADAKSGAEHIVPYTERYPPDTTACIFWLKNRRPDLWRDKLQAEHTGPGNGPVQVTTELGPAAKVLLSEVLAGLRK